ncbi:DUF4238 domain-containing protein [Pseudomonas fluorescens]|uniref:DUF4238 domain-containing protein n=1 Tax=Pseudomonas fluorescens TaxID=294 RepID=A0A423LIA2_PSEFL|nr:DUF4238 domain-containing protein [Pseudomonas fluorescens]RON68044.1 hypothetical protein BK671_13965 [Pseudomonas fluorescens]
MTDQQTHENHYVPIWYQKRFLPAPGAQLFYLDLSPPMYPKGPGKSISKRVPKSSFKATDLYTTWPTGQPNDEIERLLFGEIDNSGAVAIRQLASGQPDDVHDAFKPFFEYLGAQKLRTPKGLDWINAHYSQLDQSGLMREMQHLLTLNLTIWSEGVREIVSAKESDLKFIITDHPVTLYNAACPPGAAACRYPNEPAVQWNGTQTIFPLDAEHCLILSHLDYANQVDGLDLVAERQNARHLGRSLVRTDTWIRSRSLSREQVLAINYLLKSRARKYVAAPVEDWLYPEKEFAGEWSKLEEVLRPPANELWHFGGEMYVGYEDGSTEYQDPYGRTSGSHEYLKKTPPSAPIEDGTECGCGSGYSFAACCKDILEAHRPSWSVASIRERNLMFIGKVNNILGLDSGKSWNDVRAELNDEHVREIYQCLQALWPADTNFRELWPRPDPRVFRAVYMGCIDPRTVVTSVLTWTSYFDEVVLLNPFPNPACIRPEFSAVENPGQHRVQTLKNVMLLLELEPFIRAGIVHFVPDPGELDFAFGKVMRDMALSRAGDAGDVHDDTGIFKLLAEDDTERLFSRLSLKSISSIIRKTSPHLDVADADEMARNIKESRADDPLALQQPVEPGKEHSQLMAFRCAPLELSMFMAQVTGAALFTDLPVFWRQLHAATRAEPSAACWVRFIDLTHQLLFSLTDDPREIYRLQTSEGLSDFRGVFRSVSRLLIASQGNISSQVEQLATDTEIASLAAKDFWANACQADFARRLRVAIPEGGFVYAAVQRLVLTYGHESALKTVPLALLMEAP